MRVVIAPDSFKGTLTGPQAAAAIAAGWRRARPDDEVVCRPLSDGGDGLLDAVARPGDTWQEVEVADPLGRPHQASFLLRDDSLAVVESAQACGLSLVPPGQRNPLHATTFGVGQLLEAARRAGAQRILLGLGGSATVDGGTGALLGLGYQLTKANGDGLKIGGEHLDRIAAVQRTWSADWSDVAVELLADVRTVLADAAHVFGPQKGATPEAVEQLARGLARWADVAERDLAGGTSMRGREGTGAAGGLGFGLMAGLAATFRPGAAAVAELVGLDAALRGADLAIVGEGQLDETSTQGKVVGAVVERAREHGVATVAVVGVAQGRPDGLTVVEEAAPAGPGDDPRAEVADAAHRLAEHHNSAREL